MKKIVVPFEGGSFRKELLEFAGALNARSPILLTAAFVPEVDYAQLWNSPGGIEAAVYVPQTQDEDEVVARNSARVQQYCQSHHIDYRVHEDRYDFALGAIRKETRFADLLLLSSGHFFEIINDRQPNAYMKEILHGTECPVMLLPERAQLPGELILAYDGSASSIYAIRQFAYLFPEFSNLKTTLVYIGDPEKAGIPEEELVRELCEQHFKDFHLLQLHMQKETFCDTWIGMMTNPWLISGAFGRPEWSQLFRHSFIERMIKGGHVPLFVAHV